jgi:DNA-binding transcriptional ArsR family regulator
LFADNAGMSRRNEMPNITRIGALIGNPLRARIIGLLMDGSERPASTLAGEVGVTPQAVSAHLSNLVAGGLLAMRAQGRQRLYRICNEHVAEAIEVLSRTAMDATGETAFSEGIRNARRCYDHVAGRLGVALCQYALARRYVVANGTDANLTPAGEGWLESLKLSPPESLRRPVVRFCLDWTERQAHLAGWLGAALCRELEGDGAVRRVAGSRALVVTPVGRALLKRRFSLEWSAIEVRAVR